MKSELPDVMSDQNTTQIHTWCQANGLPHLAPTLLSENLEVCLLSHLTSDDIENLSTKASLSLAEKARFTRAISLTSPHRPASSFLPNVICLCGSFCYIGVQACLLVYNTEVLDGDDTSESFFHMTEFWGAFVFNLVLLCYSVDKFRISSQKQLDIFYLICTSLQVCDSSRILIIYRNQFPSFFFILVTSHPPRSASPSPPLSSSP